MNAYVRHTHTSETHVACWRGPWCSEKSTGPCTSLCNLWSTRLSCFQKCSTSTTWSESHSLPPSPLKCYISSSWIPLSWDQTEVETEAFPEMLLNQLNYLTLHTLYCRIPFTSPLKRVWPVETGNVFHTLLYKSDLCAKSKKRILTYYIQNVFWPTILNMYKAKAFMK